MFLYRDILKRSLEITWSHKYLWFFGLFATLLAGAGRYNMSFSRMPEDWNGSLFAGLATFVNQGIIQGNLFSNLGLLFQKDPISASIFVIFFLVVVILSLFLLWLAVVSQVGLINDSAKVIRSNGKKERATIKEGIEAGVSKFWPVLGFNVIAGAMICFFSALVGLPLVFLTPNSDISITLLYSLLFILFVPLSLIVFFIGQYAVCFSVLKGKSFVDSIVEAIRLFEKNWLVSIEMALILFCVDVLFVFLAGLIILILAVPYLFIALALSAVLFSSVFYLAVVAGIVLAIILVVLGGSILTTFKITAWTDIFINLVDKKGGLAKIVRLAENLKK